MYAFLFSLLRAGVNTIPVNTGCHGVDVRQADVSESERDPMWDKLIGSQFSQAGDREHRGNCCSSPGGR